MISNIDVQKIIQTVAIAFVPIIFIVEVSSCREKGQIQEVEETKAYLSAGCERKAYPGSTLVRWVCGENAKNEIHSK